MKLPTCPTSDQHLLSSALESLYSSVSTGCHSHSRERDRELHVWLTARQERAPDGLDESQSLAGKINPQQEKERKTSRRMRRQGGNKRNKNMQEAWRQEESVCNVKERRRTALASHRKKLWECRNSATCRSRNSDPTTTAPPHTDEQSRLDPHHQYLRHPLKKN